MKIKLLFVALFCAIFFSNAQTNKDLADKYLNKRGELAFTFTANNIDEVRKLSSIISFDHAQNQNNPLIINAIANKKNFQKFLAFNLPFTVNTKLNEPKDVVMFDPKIHKKGISGKNAAYTLTFPLTAYPTYAQYAQQMADFANDHPTIAQLVNIGQTVNGKDLLFIKLSDNVGTHEQEPRLLLTSSMHGDEIAGYPMMLSLIDFLITAYNDVANPRHTEIKNLVDNSEIWINPMANPDGTFFGSVTYTTVSGARRANANAIDLNRNYPDPKDGPNPDGNAYQAETLAFMAMADSYHFVIGANFHGGVEVVNYPWDTWTAAEGYHADDDWYQFISREYATNAQTDSPALPNYMTYLNNGITHGATWYRVAGGRQDYMNYDKHARELTIELSDVKLIAESEIQNHWNYNKNALIDFFKEGIYGFTGLVKDASTGNPIKAKITIVGRDDQVNSRNSWVETELPIGDYYRPIKAGTYDILYEADCYQSYTLTNQTITDLQTIVLPDVLLSPASAVIPTNLIASSITTTTATIGWDNTNVTSYDIQYRESGTSTWITTSSVTNSLDLTGLNANTTYEFQVRGICLTPSNYSSLATFTTFNIGQCTGNYITTFPYAESFESGYGDWTNRTNGFEDDIDWTQNTGSTPSTNTGPSAANDGSTYLYTEASINVTPAGNPNKLAEFLSPCFDLTGFKNAKFTFYYHWYGANIDLASLSIKITTDNGANYTNLYTKTGISSNSWVSQIIDLSAYNGQIIKLKIAGVTGDGFASDMAIDNFSLTAEIDTTLGIEDEILNTFQLYPNPVSSGKITLKMPNDIYEFTITISNMFGQKVYVEDVKTITNNKHTINTNAIKTGIYLVTINTDKGKATKKLIIQ